MNMIKTMLLMPRVGWITCLALLCLSQAPHARADTMLLSTTTMVSGTESAVFSFDAPSAGTVTATLSNLPWPTPLSTLSFLATSATETLSSWSAPVTQAESFQVGAGTYFAHIMAAATGPLNLGIYSLNLSFAPAVPLPASDWLLVIGVLILFGLTRILSAFGSFEGLRSEESLEGSTAR
jgi:hypothetical protein